MERTLARAHAILDDYAQAQDGWDGPGSLAPHPWSLDPARALLQDWPCDWPVPEPMISSGGTVGFYWPDRPPAFMDLEFDEPKVASLYGRWLTDDQGEFHDAVPHAELRDRMAPLMARYFPPEAPEGTATGTAERVI